MHISLATLLVSERIPLRKQNARHSDGPESDFSVLERLLEVHFWNHTQHHLSKSLMFGGQQQNSTIYYNVQYCSIQQSSTGAAQMEQILKLILKHIR